MKDKLVDDFMAECHLQIPSGGPLPNDGIGLFVKQALEHQLVGYDLLAECDPTQLRSDLLEMMKILHVRRRDPRAAERIVSALLLGSYQHFAGLVYRNDPAGYAVKIKLLNEALAINDLV